MYHEEEIINGVLCHRGLPDGEWVPYTLEALTIALTAERTLNKQHRSSWLESVRKLRAVQGILDSG